jgi:hypothetical protein
LVKYIMYPGNLWSLPVIIIAEKYIILFATSFVGGTKYIITVVELMRRKNNGGTVHGIVRTII